MPPRWVARAAFSVSSPVGVRRTLTTRRSSGRPFAAHETGRLHAVDHARQAALAEEDPVCDFGHAEPLGRILEMDQDVVPPERDPSLRLHLGVENVDERQGGLQEDTPLGTLFCGRA
jgi:hypothetical protein